MRKICSELVKTSLFSGIEESFFEPYCFLTVLRVLWKGDFLLHEGDECQSIGIVTDGQLAMQKYTGSGEAYTLGLLGPGDVFGSDMVFASEHICPVTVEAVTSSKVILLSHDVLQQIIQSHQGVELNFIRILSDRIRAQNRRISLLSQKSLRQKIAYYLLDIHEDQQRLNGDAPSSGRTSRHSVTVRLPASKEVVSRLLAMPRPSFSRELIHMEEDGLIRVQGRNIQILSPEILERDVLENLTY